MSSNEHSSRIDLERGLPTNAADVEALRRAKQSTPPMDGDAYLRFLAQFPPASHESLRKRRGPSGEPFRL